MSGRIRVDMKIDPLIGSNDVIISLDVDDRLYDKLQQLAALDFHVVELNGVNSSLITSVIQAYPRLKVGVGGILNTQQLEEAYLAGVHFATSPGFLPELVKTAEVYSINYIPGIATFSEAMHAFSLGCQHVRPYPATITFCSALNKMLPLLHLFPAEIEWQDAERFLKIPSVSGVSVLNPVIDQLSTSIA